MELVGRDAELRAADAFAAAMRGGLAALVFGGAAGIGKTSVWRAATDAVDRTGARIITTRASQVEMPIPLGHLADLLGDTLPAMDRSLPEPQRAALAIGLGLESAETVRPDWLALARATLALLALLARDQPVVIAIDDAQWLDPASQRVLAYALRRAGAGVGVLVTVRDETQALDPLTLADSVDPSRFARLQLAPLSSGALQHVLRTRLGVYVPRPTLARIHDASGGNPMFAIEFARLLGPTVGQRGPLAVPRSLEEVVAERVTRLPQTLQPLLEIVSALERPTSQLVGAALGDPRDADELVAAAIEADALAGSRDGRISFTHPLLSAAVYHRIPPGRRRELHARLALLVDSVEERGRHAALACDRRDSETATIVSDAADAAAARGALQAAAELAIEVARITPDTEIRQQRLIEAGTHLVATGEFAAARDLLDGLLAEELPPATRGHAFVVRAEAEISGRERLVGHLRAALEISDDERVQWEALIRLALHGHWIYGDGEGAAETARRSSEIAHRLGDAELIEESDEAVAFYESALGLATTHEPALDKPLPTVHLPWWHNGARVSLATRLMWAGRFEQARRVSAAAYRQLADAGQEARAGFALVGRAELEWRAGRWEDAEAAEAEATDILGDLVVTAVPRLMLLAARGDEPKARRLGSDILEWTEWLHDRYSPQRVWWSIGLLELARGDAPAAGLLFETALARLDEGGVRNPGVVPVVPDAIESRVAAGDNGGAAALADRLEDDAHRLGTPWASASARRGRALVQLADGNAQLAAASAAAAAVAFTQLGAPFDAARSLLLVGDARRRAGERRAAAAAIREAIVILERLGAPMWQERAERELRRASPRAAKDRGALTAAEERVAALVAAGRSNKQAAAELFTTVATVEAHLTRIYRKLGVRSRTELTRLVSDGTVVLHADE
ncbi:MAG TPA: AAA family ATPase [Gaiellaceae bacterium]